MANKVHNNNLDSFLRLQEEQISTQQKEIKINKKLEQLISIQLDFQNLQFEFYDNQQDPNSQEQLIEMIRQFIGNPQNSQYKYILKFSYNAEYEFWSKKFKKEEKEQKLNGTILNDNELNENNQILHLQFEFKPELFHIQYQSQKLKCESSLQLILEKENQDQQTTKLIFDLWLKPQTRKNSHRSRIIELKRQENLVYQLQVEWNLINNQLELILDFIQEIPNLQVTGVVYSRIIIRESKDFIAQTHKELGRIDNFDVRQQQAKMTFQLDQNNLNNTPQLQFGNSLESHHIIIITLKFASSCWDIFKKNTFLIEVPIDLFPQGKIFQDHDNYYIPVNIQGQEEENQNFFLFRQYQKYFDAIRLLNKYNSRQTYD